MAAEALERYALEPDCSEREFLAAAKLYARAVVDAHDLTVSVGALDWEVSRRARRRAGAVVYEGTEPRAVRLTWEQFESAGWEAAAATIRHELIHVHLLNEADDPSHGDRFEALAAELDTHVHCALFSEPEWWVVCEDCGNRYARYRRSKLVRRPDRYECGACAGDLTVRENAGG